jgi:PAS domain-containing protein
MTAEMARELDEQVAQRTRELTAANEELRRTIDAIPHAITILGPDGSTLGANAFVLDYTGLSLEEVTADRLQEERRKALLRGEPLKPSSARAAKMANIVGF